MENDREEENKKVVFTDEEITGIAKAIALAELANRTPKERNPSIPMTKDERYYRAMKEGIAKYNALKEKGEI